MGAYFATVQRLETYVEIRPAFSSADTGRFLISSYNVFGKSITSFDTTDAPLRQSEIPICEWHIRFNQHLRKEKGSIC